jgi:hypothetical protein
VVEIISLSDIFSVYFLQKDILFEGATSERHAPEIACYM